MKTLESAGPHNIRRFHLSSTVPRPANPKSVVPETVLKIIRIRWREKVGDQHCDFAGSDSCSQLLLERHTFKVAIQSLIALSKAIIRYLKRVKSHTIHVGKQAEKADGAGV